VRLKDAQKKMRPSGTTLCHSSMAGSGRWSIFSDGTCRDQITTAHHTTAQHITSTAQRGKDTVGFGLRGLVE
jgi:hypothetical protein